MPPFEVRACYSRLAPIVEQLKTCSKCARGYDFANLFANLAASLPPEPGNELLRRLEQAPPQQGASGEFKFVNSPVYGKHFEFPVAVREIRNGEPKIVTE